MTEIMDLRVIDSERNEVPSGCCLTAPELEDRTAEWMQLAGQGLIEISQDSGDLLLCYRRDPEVEAILRQLVNQERACCSALAFDISSDESASALRISGPWQETPWASAVPVGMPAHTGDIRESVRSRYAAVARGMGAGDLAGCSPGGETNGCGAVYEPEDLEHLGSLQGVSLGCGNAIALAELKDGETVLDLGSGAGLDVFVAAKRVGTRGRVYGLDMTDEMLQIARQNQVRARVENVEFLKGQIEQVPLPDASVDVIISNCVVNLSDSKGVVFAEMFRVLRPGGRVALSDVVAEEESAVRQDDLNAWAGCLAGALTQEQYRRGLEGEGVQEVTIQESHQVRRPMPRF